MAEPLNTGLSAQQVLTAFDRALNDYTDAEIDALLGEKQDTISDLSSIRSGAAAGATAVQQTAFETDQQRQETEIGVVANAGAKNRLKLNVTSKTVDGVTYTLQSDECIIVNGEAVSASFVASFYGGQFTLPAGDWLLNGCPSGGSTASYMVQIKDNSHPENPADGTVVYRDFGTGDVLISISAETTFMYVIRIMNGYTANNLVFKPMIRRAEITDSTYVPYAPTNRELYETKTEQTETNVIANLGAKNLFDIQHPSTTRDTGYNVTSDGGVELTCSNAAWTQYIIRDISVESGREYYFTLYVDAISGTDTFRAYVRDTNDSGNALYDSGNVSEAKTITRKIASSSGKIWVGVYLNNSAIAKTASAKIRGMLCPASITDSTFVPYAPTNRELYETKADASDLHALLPNITSSTTIQAYVDSLSKGVYTAFIANASNPSDSPINANCFVNIYVYSANAAAVELIPLSSNEISRTYTMRKISGTWRAWYKFEGTVVS